MSRLSVLIVLGVALSTTPAYAAPQDVANDISQQIMSPFCPGVTLHDCPSDSAVALRDRITAMAEDGFTRSQIMAELLDEYGPTLRAEPPRSGSGLLAWVLPALAALAAGAVAWTMLRKWAHVPVTPDGYDPGAHITDSDRRRLEAELNKFRGSE
jgi:cytochrome c-type biogenesis protein CcmH